MAKRYITLLLCVLLPVFLCTSCGEMEHGSISTIGYTNHWAEVFVPIKDGWNCIEGEELAQYLGVDYDSTESIDETEVGLSYEFRMEKDGGFPSLTLIFEHVDSGMDINAYFDSISAGMESDEEVAFSCKRGGKVKIAGDKYESLYVLGTYGESTIYQQYFARKIDEYIVCFLTVDIGTDTTETDELISSITKP